MMSKKNTVLISLLAVSVVFLLGYRGFGWENNLKDEGIIKVIDALALPNSSRSEAWQVFEHYLEFARTHNLAGIRSLSHQLSPVCEDPSKEAECFGLMDSVYAVAGHFEFSQFKHIQADERQIIMYTDGPTVVILYFARDKYRVPKLLGIKFCFEEAAQSRSCVETDPAKRDLNSNGWWDEVESLFR